MATRADYAPLDVAAARSAVQAGRTMRVGIKPTHQFPEGAAGRVRDVRDETVVGPEFIDVEVTIGGSKDVIPFAPGDLAPIKRGDTVPAPIARPTRRTRRAPSAAAASSARNGWVETPEPTPPPTAPSKDASPLTPAPLAPSADDTRSEAPKLTAAPRTSTRSGRSAPTAVELRISSIEPDHAGWQVEVTVNGRAVGKTHNLTPSQVWAVVQQLGTAAIDKAVAGAFETHRQRAQERADQLTRELAAAQAELATYPAVR